MWLDREQRAVVKLEVTGTTPDGTTDSREGSGFFIYSGGGRSYVITAAHVIGSNEREQSRNPDWKVENGRIQREIKVRPLNEHGTLEPGITDVFPSPLVLQGDIALLATNAYGYPILPLSMEGEATGLRRIMLLGFRAQSKSLVQPPPIGTGQLAASWQYVTDIQSWPGESGGPLIDLDTGRVVAIASGSAFQSGPTNEATPISLSVGYLRPFLPSISSTFSPPPDDEQARRADEASSYKASRGNLEKLREYVNSCKACEFKKDAQQEIASLEEAAQYRVARGNLDKLKAYVTTCSICEFRNDATTEIVSLERQQQKNKEEAQFREARANMDKLRVYVASCSICDFKSDATTEIASLERQTQKNKEEAQYRAARGDAEKLKAYIDSCAICDFKDAAASEITSLARQAQQQQEASRYYDARGNTEKLRAYLSGCSICQFRDAALAELRELVEHACDLATATDADADVPGSIPVVNIDALPADDIEQGLSACLLSYKMDGSRRYATQAGRAYAARAARRAAAGDLDGARADMDQAVTRWKTAMDAGSGAAMNFLGAYLKGSFNTRAITFVSPDYPGALDYWLKGAEAGNVKAMRNAGAVLLKGPLEYPGVQ